MKRARQGTKLYKLYNEASAADLKYVQTKNPKRLHIRKSKEELIKALQIDLSTKTK